MNYFVLIRGPLGIGKSTISRYLSKKINADYISMDEVMSKHGLDKREGAPCIPAKNFIKADDIILPEIEGSLKKGRNVVLDGCFYHKEQIDDLKTRLKYTNYAFDLKAPLEVCIQRDSKRPKVYGEGAARAVYSLVFKFDHGVAIKTDGRTEDEVIKEILSYLPK